MMPPLLASLGLTLVAFALCFALAKRLGNYGIVDVLWSLGFAPFALVNAFFAEGWLPRRWLFAGMVALWSLRLGIHLWSRVAAHHPVEDARYQRLREEWGAQASFKMFRFFLFQALVLFVLAAPFLTSFHNPAPQFSLLEWLGLGLWVCGLMGETLADLQLRRFKANPLNRGKVCDSGLWAWSRHPNYFFEWVVWLAYALFLVASPFGWWGLMSAALMLLFLTKLTGLRYTEEQLLRSKGALYRAYQQRSSAFLPLPPAWLPRLKNGFKSTPPKAAHSTTTLN